MNVRCEPFNRTIQEQFVDFHEYLLFEDIDLFNQKLADWLFLYNSWRPHQGHGLLTSVEVIIQQQQNNALCNLGWTYTSS